MEKSHFQLIYLFVCIYNYLDFLTLTLERMALESCYDSEQFELESWHKSAAY